MSSSLVVKKMNPNLKAVYENEIDYRNRMTNNVLRFHRDRGKVIYMVKMGKSLDGKTSVDYGQKPVEALSEALGVSISYAYKLATFYDIYQDNDKFQELLDFFEDRKYHLTWSHFNLLVHVNNAELRQELIHKAVENNMPVSVLRKEIASNKINVDEDGFEGSPTDSAVLSGDPPVQSAPTLAVEIEDSPKQEDEEDEEEETATKASPDTRSSDSSAKLSSVRLIKELNNQSAKFGDKLVDLVGDLTIALAEPPGGKMLKDVIKGLKSSREILNSIKDQIGEYVKQLKSMEETITPQKE
jgi:hypothetical protein